MKIEKICVEHFRSLDKVEIILSNLNTFVGPNNHGKTNFLEAINWFYSGKTKLEDKQNYKTDLEIKVEITYSDAQKSLNLMEDGKSKTTFKICWTEKILLWLKRLVLMTKESYLLKERVRAIQLVLIVL